VPDDMILCGFDDHPFSIHSSPPLTTVRPDMHGLGALAVESVINQISLRTGAGDAGVSVSPHRVYVPGRLVLRASTQKQRSGTGRQCACSNAN
jgi:DNA-binding LacI/PurR family transcriptional regulator